MNQTQHHTNNAVLGAPPGMTAEQCRALPITRVQYSDGTPGVWSFWKPTPEGLAALAGGSFVRLCVLGQTMPPVLLEVAP